MRLFPRQAAAVAALLALPLGLAACSSGGSPDPAASSSSTASAGKSPATSTTPRSDDTGSSEAGKPTRQQVAAGVTDYFVGKGVPRSLVDDVATCVADKGYSQFSAATLRALQQGKVSELNPLDAGKLTKVTTTCLANGAGGSLPSSAG